LLKKSIPLFYQISLR